METQRTIVILAGLDIQLWKKNKENRGVIFKTLDH